MKPGLRSSHRWAKRSHGRSDLIAAVNQCNRPCLGWPKPDFAFKRFVWRSMEFQTFRLWSWSWHSLGYVQSNADTWVCRCWRTQMSAKSEVALGGRRVAWQTVSDCKQISTTVPMESLHCAVIWFVRCVRMNVHICTHSHRLLAAFSQLILCYVLVV